MRMLKNRMIQLLLLLALVASALHIWSEFTFLTPRNIANIARQVAINGILSVGMTFVILLGGIDLSVGSVVALAAVVAGLVQVNGSGEEWVRVIMAVIAAISVGGGLGAFTGAMVTRYKVAPFIITLGVMVIARGLALILSDGAAIAPLLEAYGTIGGAFIPGVLALPPVVLFFLWGAYQRRKAFATLVVFLVLGLLMGWVLLGYRGLPVPTLILIGVAFAGNWILERTRWGRFVLATGGNEKAAALSGVPVQKTHFWVYVAMGVLSGVGAVILSSRLNGALPTSGQLFELDAIAAVVIGGTSLQGGRGTIIGSMVGAVFIAVMNNGMSLLAVPEFYQMVIKGILIVSAVLWDQASASK